MCVCVGGGVCVSAVGVCASATMEYRKVVRKGESTLVGYPDTCKATMTKFVMFKKV